MIALALLALAQVQAAELPSEEDIVVFARRMRSIGIDIKAPKRNGRLVVERCRVSKSSGNAELDVVPCQAAVSCAADTLTSRKVLASCTQERSRPLIDAIIARWRAQRGPQS